MIISAKSTAGETRAKAVAAYKRLARELGRRPFVREVAAACEISESNATHHLSVADARGEIDRAGDDRRANLGGLGQDSHAAVAARAATERLNRLAAQRDSVVEPSALSITEAAKRDYWRAWRRIKPNPSTTGNQR